MEEMIIKISEKVLEELRSAHKAPYPLYYKNVFVSLAKTEGIFEQLNPKLLCVEPDLNEVFLTKTARTLKEVDHVSKEIRADSENLIEEVAPLEIDDLKETILQFSTGLLQKVGKLEQTVHALEAELDRAYKELLIDPMTKVYNRKALLNDLTEILKHGEDKKLDLVVAIVDLDHFKEINDRYGHLVGDYVLIKIADIIGKMIRKENKIYRYGGDEFVIVFNRMNLDDVVNIIKRVVKKIENTKLKYKHDLINVTVSVGLTEHKKGDTFDEIIRRADMALYKAKVNRNTFDIKD